MNRRDFLKLGGMGALTVFLSGCGLSALMGTEKTSGAAATPEKGTISGGKNMKIVVINSSPHSDAESTSKYISRKFTEGAQSAGHEIFVFDAAKADTHPCAGCDACHMDGPCVYSDDIENTLNIITNAKKIGTVHAYFERIGPKMETFRILSGLP